MPGTIVIWDFDCTISSMHYFKTLNMAKHPLWTERWGGLLLEWWRGNKVPEVPSVSYAAGVETRGASQSAGTDKVPTESMDKQQLSQSELSKSHSDQTSAGSKELINPSENHVETEAEDYRNSKNFNYKEYDGDMEVDQTDDKDRIEVHERLEESDSVEESQEFEDAAIVAPRLPPKVTGINAVQTSAVSCGSQHHNLTGAGSLSEVSGIGEFHLQLSSRPNVAHTRNSNSMKHRSLESSDDNSETNQKTLAAARLRAQKRIARLNHLKRMKQRSLTIKSSPQTFEDTGMLESED